MTPKAVVVGAGAGGVATAARLAKQGFQVTVIEKNGFIGGRCSLITHNGYRFDQGPSLLLMPEVFHDTFNQLGTSLEEEGIKLLKCEPNYRLWFTDNDSFDLSTDIASLKPQIEKYEGKEGFQNFLQFMQESGRHHDLSLIHVLRRRFPSLLSMLRPGFLLSVFKMHPFESIHGRLSRYFRSEKMRRIFTFASMYLGMNPYEAPGTYSLLQYTELADGIWYPAGGFQKVLESIATIGKSFGVEYRLNSPVSSILLSGDSKSATGVVLSSGERLDADIVVINADLVYAYQNLLPASKEACRLSNRPASCSSISFFWSFDRVVPELKAHNIFLAEKYEESFDAIFKYHKLPDEPSFYVNVPSRIDRTAAPDEKDAVVVLVPTGHLLENTESITEADWITIVSKARETAINTIEARTGVRGLRDILVHESIETPVSWKEKFNLDRGAILGLSHSFFNVLSFRPKNKHPDIARLYFVGASTHPGTGVPVCLAGSKLVVDQVVEDWNADKKSSLAGICLVIVSMLIVMVSLMPFVTFCHHALHTVISS
ncbi:phytoene desaturase family protein [Aspergillus ruber CBS 135680]|uniref:Phytoene desaturase n=1 Tax=Aspergillus ruber (strain CBS 135680) TaxID=1388766 RepID=A0A017RZD5_ASPRC|nr:phytoene dehydrogenase [Aspergillus ruber CBS 135680]EYE90128.1 phytoene dehydrogenase [Aspergillus ruber CBS 135680]